MYVPHHLSFFFCFPFLAGMLVNRLPFVTQFMDNRLFGVKWMYKRSLKRLFTHSASAIASIYQMDDCFRGWERKRCLMEP